MDGALSKNVEAGLEVGDTMVERRHIGAKFSNLLIEEFQCVSGVSNGSFM